MHRYLLLDSGCSQCTEIAQAVEQATQGGLEARSLRDPARGIGVPFILLLCLIMLFSVTFSIQAFVSPANNRVQNPGFETGNMSPWFRDGNAQYVTIYAGTGQHETFFWPDGAAHGWSSLWNTGDRWWGEVWNRDQPGNQYGALAQGIALTPNQRYRLSAWMVAGSGAFGYLRWYANNVTYLCAGPVPTNWPGNHVIWPIANNLSCEFTPNNTNGFNVRMAAYVDTGEWVIADDWALTQLVDVPPTGWPRLPLPISYWARDYGKASIGQSPTGRLLLEGIFS